MTESAPGAHAALGIDIGGTGIKAEVVDCVSGTIRGAAIIRPTPNPATPDAVLGIVATLLRDISWSGPIGIGYPGVVKNGIARSAANVDDGWKNFPIAERFGALTDQTVRVMNDADAAGLAELRFGAARDQAGDSGATVLMTTFGTGIGTAFFHRGRLFPNTEFGHVELNGGDAEDYAAASIKTKLGLSWSEWGARVHEYLAMMEMLLSPELIVFGGGVSENFDHFKAYLDTRAEVRPAQLGNDAGIIGAALATDLPQL